MINLNHSEVVLYVEDPQLQKSSQDIYWLTSTDMLSKYVIVILQNRETAFNHSPAWFYFSWGSQVSSVFLCLYIIFRGVSLGGKPLVLNVDNLPELNPVHQQPSDTITISPLSYGFIVFKEAHALACVQ